MAGREARAKRATTAFTRWESSECTFFPGNYFFFDHHAIQGENPKVSKRPAKKKKKKTVWTLAHLGLTMPYSQEIFLLKSREQPAYPQSTEKSFKNITLSRSTETARLPVRMRYPCKESIICDTVYFLGRLGGVSDPPPKFSPEIWAGGGGRGVSLGGFSVTKPFF